MVDTSLSNRNKNSSSAPTQSAPLTELPNLQYGRLISWFGIVAKVANTSLYPSQLGLRGESFQQSLQSAEEMWRKGALTAYVPLVGNYSFTPQLKTSLDTSLPLQSLWDIAVRSFEEQPESYKDGARNAMRSSHPGLLSFLDRVCENNVSGMALNWSLNQRDEFSFGAYTAYFAMRAQITRNNGGL